MFILTGTMAHMTPSAPAMGVMPPANIMPPIAIFSTSNPTPTSMHMVGDPLTIAAAMAGTSPMLATNANTGVVPSAGSTAQLPSVPVPVGMFMGDGLIPLPPRLLKKIQAMEFIDMAELMPETWLSETTEEAHNTCCGILTAVKKRKSPVIDILLWVQCYAALVAVLALQHPQKIPEFMAYQSVIIKCHRDFEGLGWVYYDRAFRRQAALSKDLNWSRINPTLYSLCFAGKAKKSAICIHCLSNNHNSDQCPEIQNMWPSQCSLFQPAYTGPFPGPAVPVTPAVEICRLFNAKGESRCRYKRCRYLHACARCRGDHPQSACPSRFARSTKQTYDEAAAPKIPRLH